MELTQTEWIVTAISGGVLTIVTGTIKYWVAKVKRHSERIAVLEEKLALNEERDESYRKGLADKIKLQVLELTKSK